MSLVNRQAPKADGLAGLRANRSALNRDDEGLLLYAAKGIAKSAALFPSLTDYTVLRTAKALIEEALSHEPR